MAVHRRDAKALLDIDIRQIIEDEVRRGVPKKDSLGASFGNSLETVVDAAARAQGAKSVFFPAIIGGFH